MQMQTPMDSLSNQAITLLQA
jgi:predicted nuclease with RNAse H fold